MLRHARSGEDVLASVRGQTIPSLFVRTVRARADQPAIRWREAGAWRQWTWSQYADGAARVAAGLRAAGVERHERVALMMRNGPAFHPADMGISLAGATSFSIYNSSSIEQVTYVLEHSEAAVAIAGDADLHELLRAASSRVPGVRRVLAVDDPALIDTPALDLEAAADAVDPDDVATFIYTSGTTGPPKAVMLTHQNICAVLEALVATLGIELGGRRMVSYLPMAHIAERLLTQYLPARAGVVAHPWADVATVADYLPMVRPELFFGPPRVFEKLCSTMRIALDGGADAAAVRADAGLDECRVAFTGAAPLPPSVVDFYGEIGLPVPEWYGLSETAGMVAAEQRAARPRTVGRPIPGCEIRLADDGEVLCRGPFVFAGYFKDPVRTTEALDDEGWLHTGDIGVVDDAYLRIVDRKKELIVTSGGKNVAPANLENALKHLPLIGQACVVGDGHPFITALLVLDPDAAPVWAAQRGIEAASLTSLAEHPDLLAEIAIGVDGVNAEFSNAERIKKFVVLGDEWQADSDVLTPTMKLKRRAVVERYAEIIERLYAS